jgi:hypothetical protein
VNEGVNQTFGVNLKYYQGHNASTQYSKEEKEKIEKTSDAEGVWTLKPEFGSEAKQYSNSSNDGNNVVF